MKIFFCFTLTAFLFTGCCSRKPQIHMVEWYENGNPKKIVYDNFKKDTVIQIGGTNEVKNENVEHTSHSCSHGK